MSKVRSAALTIIALVVFGLVAADGFADETGFKATRLHERVLSLQSGFWALNMLAVDAGDALVVLDTLAEPREAEESRKIIEATFGKRVTHLINSHHHWDHTFGNQAFADVEIIASDLCLEDMKSEYSNREALETVGRTLASEGHHLDIDSLKLTLPTRTYSRKAVYKIGDFTFVLYNQPGLHTRNHSTLFIPELGLIALRMAFHPGRLPAFEEGIDLPQLIVDLQEIIDSGVELKFIVQGHGDPYQGGGIDLHIDYLKAMAAIAEKYKSPKEVKETDLPARVVELLRSNSAWAKVHSENLEIILAR